MTFLGTVLTERAVRQRAKRSISSVAPSLLGIAERRIFSTRPGGLPARCAASGAEVDAERARSDEKEKMWLERVEAKEIAYDRLLGEIAVRWSSGSVMPSLRWPCCPCPRF